MHSGFDRKKILYIFIIFRFAIYLGGWRLMIDSSVLCVTYVASIQNEASVQFVIINYGPLLELINYLVGIDLTIKLD